LKKRSKKLLAVLASAFPDRLSPNEPKFVGSFFQKRTASFTSKDFRIFTETRYFLKKRTKKLLFLRGSTSVRQLNEAPNAMCKSFLVLFFKKELL
jgi:hypothetical protein